MFLSKLSINRPVMVSVGLLIFVIFGMMAYLGLSLNLTPDADLPVITIQTIYPGAGPKEVETQITKKIEDAVSTVSKLDYVESYSLDNVSIVMIFFEIDKDVDIALNEIKQKVDAILIDMPDDAKRPTVDKYNPLQTPIMNIAFYGDKTGLELYEFADKNLKERFSQIDGVAKVDVNGGQEREIHVKLDDKVVFQNSLSLVQLTQIVGASNMDLPGGNFKQKDQEYSVKVEGEFDEVESLNQMNIPTPFGMKRLRQLASVSDTGEEIRKRSLYYNNIEKFKEDNVVLLSIVKTSEGNPVAIAESVRKSLDKIKKSLPEGTKLEIVSDDTIFIKGTVDDTLSNVILGVAFTALVLLFFLHDIRSTFIVATAMPISIVSTFLLMDWAGFSLNMMSLMGISTAVGVLVSNSVVVLENIFRHKELGKSRIVASDIGTSEVTTAVMASTLTNIVVFVPLANINSMIGIFLKEFALTVTFATIVSLVISFTLTPMLASLILPERKKKSIIGDKLEKMFHQWESLYKKSLNFVLKNKINALIVTVLAFGIFGLIIIVIGPQLGIELMPVLDEGQIKIDMELPVGYTLEETSDVYDEIEEKLRKHEEIEQLIVKLGYQSDIDQGVNLATLTVTLNDEREKSIDAMIEEILNELSEITNLTVKLASKQSFSGGMTPIEFYLQGYDNKELTKYAKMVTKEAQNIDGLLNFDSNARSGKPEIVIIPKREKMTQFGLTVYDIALTVRASVEGLTSTQYNDKGEEYDVIISLNDESVDSPEKIKNIPIISPMGALRLSQVAEIKYSEGTTKIVHRDKINSIKFTGDIAQGFVQGNLMKEIDSITEQIDIPEGYRFIWTGMSEMMEENTSSMVRAFAIAMLLTYLLLAAILENWFKPFLILVTVPLALIGVLTAMYLTNTNMGMSAMIGIVMLIGIVVNAAILLLDYTEILRKEKGYSNKNALIEACPTKLKPILMSSIAIIFGMLPMALGIGESGAEARIPIGIVSIGGLVVSTIMTLYVMPAMYYLTTKKFIKAKERV